MKDERTVKELCEILNISQSKIEQLIRIERFSVKDPEIFDKVKSGELSINKADALIQAMEQGKGLTKYARIPLTDPYRAAEILIGAFRNNNTDLEFIKTLGNKLLELDD